LPKGNLASAWIAEFSVRFSLLFSATFFPKPHRVANAEWLSFR
jgi:hypothetical protein